MDQQQLDKGEGPIGLILAPTRELAKQIEKEAKKFAKAYQIKCAVVNGGQSKTEQFKQLRFGTVEILVATPVSLRLDHGLFVFGVRSSMPFMATHTRISGSLD